MYLPFRPAPRTIKAAAALLASSALLAGAGALAGTSSAATESSPWNQGNYNAADSRANLTEQVLTPANVSSVRYLRSIAGTPATDPEACFGGPMVPVLTGGDVYAVSNGRLIKADAATGAILWRRTADPTFLQVFVSIAVANGLVVLGGTTCDSSSDPNGYVQAFSTTTGALAWRRNISSAGGALWEMGVSGGYVAAAGSSDGSGTVVAVRSLSSGAQVWHHVTDPCQGSGLRLLVVAKQVITVGCDASGNAMLEADSLTTGTRTWTRPGIWVIGAGDSGTLTGHNLVVTNPSGAMLDLNPLTGATRFSLAGATRVLAIDPARIYADCGADLCAYSTTSGALVWRDAGLGVPRAAEANGVLYLNQGMALNAGTGALIATIWPTVWPSTKAASMAVGDGRIAVVADPRVVDLYGLSGF